VKLFCKPKALIHYSKVSVSDFQQRLFKVNTQGRLYTLDLFDHSPGHTTASISPRCVLIFTDKALDKFELHPWFTLLGFKCFNGQYWTRKVGDVTWSSNDQRIHGNVIHIRDIQIVPIRSKRRARCQSLKINTRRLFDWGLISFLLAVWGVYLFARNDSRVAAVMDTVNHCVQHYYHWGVVLWSLAYLVASAWASKTFYASRVSFTRDLVALGLVRTAARYVPDTDCLCYKATALLSRAVARIRSLWS